jgi:hypothetical protein
MKNITIKGFEHYLIDKNGIVYNSKAARGMRPGKPAQLKSWPNKKNNYHSVVLRNGIDKPKSVYVHRLVAQTYLPNALNLPEVNHKDFDKSNNTLQNLEWVTRQQNRFHWLTQYKSKIDIIISNPILLKEGIELYKKHGRLDAITELWNCSTIYCSNILKMNGVKIFKKNKLSHYLKVKLLFEYENTNMKPRHFKKYIKDKYKLDITGYLYVELRKGLPEKTYTNSCV